MANKREALDAMISVSLGTASIEEKLKVESLDERTFSELYSVLEEHVLDNNYAIEDYYKINKGKLSLKELDEDEDDDEDDDEDLEDLDFEEGEDEDDDEDDDEDEEFEKNPEDIAFEKFYKKNKSKYSCVDDAYRDFLENYCNRNYSFTDWQEEIKNQIIDEYNDFLYMYGDNYEDENIAYEDYVDNYCSF